MQLRHRKLHLVSNCILFGTLAAMVSVTLEGSVKQGTSISIEVKEPVYVTPNNIVTATPAHTPCVLDNTKGTSTECTYEVPVYDIPLSAGLQKYTFDTCVEYGIEKHYELILAMMWHESNFNVNAKSTTNDYGIMQINALNHSTLKKKLKFVDIMDPESNIESGIYLISSLLKKYDEHKALMAYNMGEAGAKKQWRRGNYSSSYSRDVMAKADKILAKAAK